MIGLTSLEVYKSNFIITEHNNNFKLCTDIHDEFSFMDLQDELEGFFDIKDITPKHLQDEKNDHLIVISIRN